MGPEFARVATEGPYDILVALIVGVVGLGLAFTATLRN